MSRRETSSRGRGAPILFAAAAVAVIPACVPADPYWLVGAWTFETGSTVTLMCDSDASDTFANVPIRFTETPDGLDLDLGCRCRLQMDNDGRLASEGQKCELVVNLLSQALDVEAKVDQFTVTAPDGQDADVRQADVAGTAVLDKDLSRSCRFSIHGRLARVKEDRRPRCSAAPTAVGVLPYHSNGITSCPIGAGVDALRITMGDDNRTGCNATSSDGGAPPWLLPESPRRLPPCNPERANGSRMNFSFCRVDGQLFTPIAGIGPGNSYAVLQLGEECPAGAVSVQKRIDNEDETQSNDKKGVIDPNASSNGGEAGTVTILNFCLFRGIQQESASAASFPDLGFPYAVFHAFDGPQPSWVLSKRWQRSDDESSDTNGNEYRPSSGWAFEELEDMIGDEDTDTIFDMARVH